MPVINRFNVRAYGLLFNNRDEILLVHEKMNGFQFTKFPGGGLEPGEGLKDCLVREFREETNLHIEVKEHFYTTDFFQQSAFRDTDQIISVYYIVKAFQDPVALIPLHEFDIHGEKRKETLRFFWVKREMLREAMLTFPIDKVVCRKLTGAE